jgi:hypothetical protein
MVGIEVWSSVCRSEPEKGAQSSNKAIYHDEGRQRKGRAAEAH